MDINILWLVTSSRDHKYIFGYVTNHSTNQQTFNEHVWLNVKTPRYG